MRNKRVFISFALVLCTATTAYAMTSGNPVPNNPHGEGIIFHYEQLEQDSEIGIDSSRVSPTRFDEASDEPIPTTTTRWV